MNEIRIEPPMNPFAERDFQGAIRWANFVAFCNECKKRREKGQGND